MGRRCWMAHALLLFTLSRRNEAVAQTLGLQEDDRLIQGNLSALSFPTPSHHRVGYLSVSDTPTSERTSEDECSHVVDRQEALLSASGTAAAAAAMGLARARSAARAVDSATLRCRWRLPLSASARRRRRSVKTLAPKPGSDGGARFLKLHLVVDHGFVSANGGEARARERALAIVDLVRSHLRDLGIHLALVGLDLWSVGNEFALSRDYQQVLDAFRNYTRDRLRAVDTYGRDRRSEFDAAHLLFAGHSFKDGVSGYASRADVCSLRGAAGLSRDYGRSLPFVAMGMAHEIAHNLGMTHDDDPQLALPTLSKPCVCHAEDGSGPAMCIMNSTVSPTVFGRHWSNCSVKYTEWWLKYFPGSACLRNAPSTVIGGPACGNFIVEAGEHCDCGPSWACADGCCDAASCRLTPQAVCSSGDDCCDASSCEPMPAATLCRAAADAVCDLPEYCTGASQHCPADLHVADGAPCAPASDAAGDSHCYGGACQTRASQCRQLYGPAADDGDATCYIRRNTLGAYFGNCGYDARAAAYRPCSAEQVVCGQLQCSGDSGPGLVISVPSRVSSYVANVSAMGRGRQVVSCRTLVVAAQPGFADPGQVPDGAKCGDGSVCVNKTCTPLPPYDESCPGRCSGRGRCNNLLRCHCDLAYAPPSCATAGSGGSVDGGPAALYSDQGSTVWALVVTLAFCPLLAIAGAAVWRARRYGGGGFFVEQLRGLCGDPAARPAESGTDRTAIDGSGEAGSVPADNAAGGAAGSDSGGHSDIPANSSTRLPPQPQSDEAPRQSATPISVSDSSQPRLTARSADRSGGVRQDSRQERSASFNAGSATVARQSLAVVGQRGRAAVGRVAAARRSSTSPSTASAARRHPTLDGVSRGAPRSRGRGRGNGRRGTPISGAAWRGRGVAASRGARRVARAPGRAP